MKKAFWILATLLLASVAVNVVLMMRGPQTETKIEHDTVWKDSIIREPVATETKETGETIYVKVPAVRLPVGSDTHSDSPHCDVGTSHVGTVPSVSQIALPVEQKRYDDSLYTAWVSGFRPNLDSILIHQREITTTVTKTIVKPAPRLSVGIQAGAGYGIINRQPDIYIGIGAQWRIWQK